MSKDTKGYEAKCHISYPPTKVNLKACSVFITAEVRLLLSVIYCLARIRRVNIWRKPPVLCNQGSWIVLYWCPHSNSKTPVKFPACSNLQGNSISWRESSETC